MHENELKKLSEKGRKVEFDDLLFYFINEFHINPLDEEYSVTPKYIEKQFLFFRWKKKIGYSVIKKGISSKKFAKLLRLADKQHQKEKMQMEMQKWASRR